MEVMIWKQVALYGERCHDDHARNQTTLDTCNSKSCDNPIA